MTPRKLSANNSLTNLKQVIHCIIPSLHKDVNILQDQLGPNIGHERTRKKAQECGLEYQWDDHMEFVKPFEDTIRAIIAARMPLAPGMIIQSQAGSKMMKVDQVSFKMWEAWGCLVMKVYLVHIIK